MNILPRLSIVFGLTLLFSQSSSAQAVDSLAMRPAEDGWIHYSNDFDIELPSLLKAHTKGHNGMWIFTSLDLSAIQLNYEQIRRGDVDGIGAVVWIAPFRSQSDWDEEEKLSSSIVGKDASVKILLTDSMQKSSLIRLENKGDVALLFRKTVRNGDKLCHLQMMYSPKKQSVIDSILPRIAASFH